MFASGGVLLSAGGTNLKVWDVLSGGRLLHCASNHQKAILSLCLHEESSRVTSGGLDGQLKVYDTTDYKVTQNMRFPAPVRDPTNMDYPPTRWPRSPRFVVQCAPRASNGPNHLGLCALR